MIKLVYYLKKCNHCTKVLIIQNQSRSKVTEVKKVLNS